MGMGRQVEREITEPKRSLWLGKPMARSPKAARSNPHTVPSRHHYILPPSTLSGLKCFLQKAKAEVMVVHTCAPSPWEVETGRSGVQD